jgi:hypothetical protein
MAPSRQKIGYYHFTTKQGALINVDLHGFSHDELGETKWVACIWHLPTREHKLRAARQDHTPAPTHS